MVLQEFFIFGWCSRGLERSAFGKGRTVRGRFVLDSPFLRESATYIVGWRLQKGIRSVFFSLGGLLRQMSAKTTSILESSSPLSTVAMVLLGVLPRVLLPDPGGLAELLRTEPTGGYEQHFPANLPIKASVSRYPLFSTSSLHDTSTSGCSVCVRPPSTNNSCSRLTYNLTNAELGLPSVKYPHTLHQPLQHLYASPSIAVEASGGVIVSCPFDLYMLQSYHHQ